MALVIPEPEGISVEQAQTVIDRLLRADVGDVLVVEPLADEAEVVTGRVSSIETVDDGDAVRVGIAGEDDGVAYTVEAITCAWKLEAETNPSPQLYSDDDVDGEDVASVEILSDDDIRPASPPVSRTETGPRPNTRAFASSRAQHQANAT
jgi:hypothetical protein